MTTARNINPRRRRPVAAGAIAVALAIAAIAAGVLASSPAARATQTKPTIVLVHGGWADSSGWNSEVSELQQRGYPVIAPANPLRGLASDAAYLRSILETIDGPIVLVGHSYGGAVITNAAVGVPQVKALVYIAAFAPDKGESLVQLVTMNPGSGIGPQTLITRQYPLPGGGDGTDLHLTKTGFETAFAGDVPKRRADQMWAEQRPFSQEALASLSGEPAWKTIPSWYLVATQDARDPARDGALHGCPRAREGVPRQRIARPDGVQARSDDEGDPRGSEARRLIPASPAGRTLTRLPAGERHLKPAWRNSHGNTPRRPRSIPSRSHG